MSQPLPTFPPEADFRDLDVVAAGLAALVPDAEPIRPVTILGVGYYSSAVETASGHVFLLGCTDQVMARHEKEARLLPWLQERLPLEIPQPRWQIAAGPVFPYGGIGYRKLPGRTVTPEVRGEIDNVALARDLGAFIRALHAVPVPEALAHGASPLSERRPELIRLRRNVMAILALHLQRECLMRVARWWESYFTESEMGAFAPVLTHGDFGGQNLLVDEHGRLTGVLDWEHAAEGDPALDFRQLPSFGAEALSTALDSYASLRGIVDAGLTKRVQRHREQSFWTMQMAARRGDDRLMMREIGRVQRRFGC